MERRKSVKKKTTDNLHVWGEDAGLIHPYFLYFPPTLEKIYLEEYLGRDFSYLLVRKVLIVAVIFTFVGTCINIIPIFKGFEKWQLLTVGHYAFVFMLSCIGVLVLMRMSLKGWKESSANSGITLVPVPLSIGIAVAMLQVFRYEFVLLLTRENVSISTPHLYFLMVSIGVGIIIRYLTSAITMAIFSLIILARTLFMVFREPDPSSAILDFFGRIAPIFFSAVFCFIGTYHNDKLSRRNFVRGKRIKLEILRLSKHRKLVSKLLHLMLPASVIPRLKALEMDFSTIVDDIEQGYCVFLDLCDGRGIMDIQRRIQVINMNFGRFDEFLKKWTEFEKIKTISTNIILLLPVNGDAEKAAIRVTEFANDVRNVFGIKRANIDNEEQDEVRDDPLKVSYKMGISFGFIVAGIVGKLKFCYDVFGDTVNTASRMQKIKGHDTICTKQVYDTFPNPTSSQWRSLGLHNVKGKGSMEVYALNLPTTPQTDPSSIHSSTMASQHLNQTSLLQLLAQNPFLSDTEPIHIVDMDRSAFVVSTGVPGSSWERSAGVPGSSWERSTGVPGSSWERMTPGASGFFAPGGSVLGLKEEPCDPIATNVKCGSSYMAISPIPVDLVDVTTSSIDIWVLLDKLRCTFKDPAIESHFNQSSVVENAYKGFISAIFGSGFLFLLAGLTLLYEARYSPEEFTEKIGVVMGLPLSALIEMMFLFMHAGLYGTIIYTKDNVERTQCSRRLSICYVLRVFNITVFTLLFVMYSFYGGVGMEGSGRSSLVMFMIIYVHHVEPVEVVFWGEVVGLVGSVVMAVGVSKAMKAMSLTDMVDITACVIASGLGKYSQRVLMRTEYLMGQVLVRNEQEIKKEMIKAAGLLKAILPSRVIRRWLSGNGSLCDIVESFKHVTVLYLDVVSFTVLSSNISPTRLIAILNTVFTEFDEICQRSKVEKVLQIGDAFMASILEGMSTRTPDPDAIRRSAQTVCSVSLEIQSAVQRFTFPDIGAFQIRVGVHSGSGVGFVSGGESMIKYELVGEVAEIVERVQEVAEPGMVVMTEATKALLDLVRVKCEVMAGRVDGLELFVLKECQKPKDGRSFMTKESVKRKLNPH